MILLLTAGIMGIALFLLAKLAKRVGVRMKGRALALSGILAAAIALGIPFVAPFLTPDYYVKLAALAIAAAVLVTAYNAYLCKKESDAADESEAAEPSESEAPEATLADRTRAAIGPDHFKWERPRKETAPEPVEDVAPAKESTPEPEPAPLVEPKPIEEPSKIVLPGPGPAPETMDEPGVIEETPEVMPDVISKNESSPQPTPPPLGEVAPQGAERVAASEIPDSTEKVSKSDTALPSPPRVCSAPPPEGEALGVSKPEEIPEPKEIPKPEQTPKVTEEPKAPEPIIEEPKVTEEPEEVPASEVTEKPEEIPAPEPTPDPMDDITAEIALLKTLDDFLDYAEAAQKQGDLLRATTAYANAVDRFVSDPYIIYLYMDLGNLLKQQARYADCVNVYHAALSIPILAENPAIAREFEKNIRYLGVVQAVLRRHHAEDTPFGNIPEAIRAEIEAADQALAAKQSASKGEQP